MLNSLNTYRAEGVTAGRAMRQRDVNLCAFQVRWFTRALALEDRRDWPAIKQAWAKGYREGYPLSARFEPFR